jgi:hypothetical protein
LCILKLIQYSKLNKGILEITENIISSKK